MSNRTLVIILMVLLGIGFFLFVGGASKNAEAPADEPIESKEAMPQSGTHTMPDGTVMKNNDSRMSEGMHMMPDGTMMAN